MSGDVDFALTAQSLTAAVLIAVRFDPDLQAILGDPARVIDAESPAPAYPYIAIERQESQAADTAQHRGLQHTLHFAAYTRNGGLQDARALVGVLAAALERLDIDLPDQRVVLVLPTYCDVLRTKTQNLMRGLLRVKIYTEEVWR